MSAAAALTLDPIVCTLAAIAAQEAPERRRALPGAVSASPAPGS